MQFEFGWLQDVFVITVQSSGFRFETFQSVTVDEIQSWRSIQSPNCQDGVLLTLSYGSPYNTFVLYQYNYFDEQFEALNHTSKSKNIIFWRDCNSFQFLVTVRTFSIMMSCYCVYVRVCMCVYLRCQLVMYRYSLMRGDWFLAIMGGKAMLF